METAAKIPVCFSMKRYKRRKKYQRLKRSSTNAEDYYDEKEAISMLEAADHYQYRRKGNSWKSRGMVIPKASGKNINVEPLRKWRDAYEEMMLCFAGHFKQLNNGNVYLFKRIPKANSQRLGDN